MASLERLLSHSFYEILLRLSSLENCEWLRQLLSCVTSLQLCPVPFPDIQPHLWLSTQNSCLSLDISDRTILLKWKLVRLNSNHSHWFYIVFLLFFLVAFFQSLVRLSCWNLFLACVSGPYERGKQTYRE